MAAGQERGVNLPLDLIPVAVQEIAVEVEAVGDGRHLKAAHAHRPRVRDPLDGAPA